MLWYFRAKLNNVSLVDEEQLLIAKAKLLSLMREMSSSKKLSERKKSARLAGNLQNMNSNVAPAANDINLDIANTKENEFLDEDWFDGPDFELMFRKDGDESL